MSSGTFPSLIGLDIEVERKSEFRTDIHQTVSGKEQRTTWWSTPRHTYILRFNVLRSDIAAPAPDGAISEVAVVLKYLADNRGSWDSFNFTDPYTGSTARVRFLEDSLTVKRISSTVWECTVKLITVK